MYRPYRIIGSSQRQAVAQLLQQVWSDWVANWLTGFDGASITLDVQPALPADTATLDAGCAVAGGSTDLLFGQIRQWLLHSAEAPAADSISAALLQQACAELHGQFLHALRSAAEPVADTTWWTNYRGPNSGVIRAAMYWQSQLIMEFWLSPRMTRHTAVGMPPIRPQLFGKLPLNCEIVLKTTEVSVNDLLNLRPGDVVRVEQGIGEAVTLRTQGGLAVCRGYLGRNGDHKAFVATEPSAG